MKIECELKYFEGTGKDSGKPYNCAILTWKDNHGKEHTMRNFFNGKLNYLYLTKENIQDLKEEYSK